MTTEKRAGYLLPQPEVDKDLGERDSGVVVASENIEDLIEQFKQAEKANNDNSQGLLKEANADLIGQAVRDGGNVRKVVETLESLGIAKPEKKKKGMIGLIHLPEKEE